MIPAITALVVALTGLVSAVGGMLVVIMKRTKATDIKVNGHLTKLLDILSQADVVLPSGAKVRYEPPSVQTIDEQNALDYLRELREQG